MASLHGGQGNYAVSADLTLADDRADQYRAFDRKGIGMRDNIESNRTSRWGVGAVLAFVLTLLLVCAVAGCTVKIDRGEERQGGTIPSLPDNSSSYTTVSTGTVTAEADGEDDARDGTAADLFSKVPRAEIERRLDLSPFSYVAEVESDPQILTKELQRRVAEGSTSAMYPMLGNAAYVDSNTDSLIRRPSAGSQPLNVAVNPDGTVFYMTDLYEPAVHIMDCESLEKRGEITLPGIDPIDPFEWMSKLAQETMTYESLGGCAGSLAVTPDGEKLLVCTQVGIQIIDLASGVSERTLPDVRGLSVVVSFDGTRAYVATHDWHTRGGLTLEQWNALSHSGEGGSLTVLDTATWKVMAQRECGVAGGLAMKPDDTLLCLSDRQENALRVVDTRTLADVGLVRVGASEPSGVGVLPNGSKVYVVCVAEAKVVGGARITPEQLAASGDWFLAVIPADTLTVIKKIPLEMY